MTTQYAPQLNVIRDVQSLVKDRTPEGFLMGLGGPSLLTFAGRDTQRCRVIVTLLHGNEPSGLRAVMTLAQQGWQPAVTTHVIIASTAAAATLPMFSHRMLPGCEDLNRCFSGRGDSPQYALADAIVRTIISLEPECVIDLHNTSGSGPAFCVSVSDSAQHQALASAFAPWMIVTDIRLGSLMEQSLGCPVVTIEAGGAKDALADRVALAGIIELGRRDNPLVASQPVSLLCHPRRLELQTGCTVAYQDGPDTATDVCLRTDIESLNFGCTPAGTHLGWVREEGLAAFRLDCDDEAVSAFFTTDEHSLFNKVPLRLFMVTTNADIARSDCLFYFIPT
ncbi:succinylglutamate desuccinylase/aspartoacylase domain-containing protein [Alteromonas sp. CYL-A6]|uniref:succinylglutamate desuccinylase/aspartoacylase domain-containing protein n=1 Tax=Alteromonas nitratireducens TaxID=3390813 RepID=UPI0034A90A7F